VRSPESIGLARACARGRAKGPSMVCWYHRPIWSSSWHMLSRWGALTARRECKGTRAPFTRDQHAWCARAGACHICVIPSTSGCTRWQLHPCWRMVAMHRLLSCRLWLPDPLPGLSETLGTSGAIRVGPTVLFTTSSCWFP